MSTKLLAAFTAHTGMPPYINASLDDEGRVVVIVRGNATIREGGKWPVADCAQMTMDRETFLTWAGAAIAALK